MDVFHISGRVFPSHRKLTLNPFKNISRSAGDLTMKFNITIIESAIEVECHISKFGQRESATANYHALTLIKSATDLVSFQLGVALDPVLETITTPAGEKHDLEMRYAHLTGVCTAFESGPGFQELFERLANTGAGYVMRDLIAGLDPRYTVINCARAMDGIKFLCGPETEERKAWCQMRDKLRLDEPYLKFITKTSHDHRHGNYSPISGETVMEVARRSWIVMDRFLHLLRRDVQTPLPEHEFPFLTDPATDQQPQS